MTAFVEVTVATLSQHELPDTPCDGASERRVDTNVLTWSFE